MRHLWTLVLAAILAMGVSSAFAQAPGVPPVAPQADSAAGSDGQGGAFFARLQQIAEQINTRLTTDVSSGMYQAGVAAAGALTSPALSVAGVLALIYLLVEVIKAMASKTSMVQVLFDVVLPVIVVAALINDYAGKMGSFQQFLNILSNLTPSLFKGLMAYFSSALEMVSRAMTQANDNLFKWSNLTDLRKLIAPIIDFLATLAFCILILYILISGLAEIVALFLLGPFLFAIGVAFGPMFIAALVTPWTRSYFEKWLGFIVASAMVTGVAGIAIQIASSVFASMKFGASASDMPVAISLAIGAIMLMSINAVLGQIPSIASALVPGTLGVSKTGGGAIDAGTKKSLKVALGGVKAMVKRA